MVVVYKSSEYSEGRVSKVYARKLTATKIRVFEVTDSSYTIREFDIEAPSIAQKPIFHDGYQHQLDSNELNTVNRLVNIASILESL